MGKLASRTKEKKKRKSVWSGGIEPFKGKESVTRDERDFYPMKSNLIADGTEKPGKTKRKVCFGIRRRKGEKFATQKELHPQRNDSK